MTWSDVGQRPVTRIGQLLDPVQPIVEIDAPTWASRLARRRAIAVSLLVSNVSPLVLAVVGSAWSTSSFSG